MCVIIDANIAHNIFRENPHPNLIPVFNWLHNTLGNGSMVYGGRNARELFLQEGSLRFVRALNQAGRAYYYPDECLSTEEQTLIQSCACYSNDPHIIALAIVSGARTLCSYDQALHQDFRDRNLINNPRGSIYQTANHRHLLRHTISCPNKN